MGLLIPHNLYDFFPQLYVLLFCYCFPYKYVGHTGFPTFIKLCVQDSS